MRSSAEFSALGGARPLARALYTSRDYRFWVCQLTGWFGYSLVTLFGQALAGAEMNVSQVAQISLQALCGVLLTWALRPLYRAVFARRLVTRLLVGGLAVLLVSAVWAALRLQLFAAVNGSPPAWSNFGEWYFSSIFVFVSWTVLYFGIKYYELFLVEHSARLEEKARREEEQSRRLRAETSARDAQLQMLRYQLNPHFLFNTLNAINALVLTGDAQRAGSMIQQLSRFLRHSLKQENKGLIPLGEELESLMLYLDIEKARFEDRLSLAFTIDPASRKALVPEFILQPLVENAMEHAITPREEGGTVSLSSQVLDDKLLLEIADNGPGMDASALEGSQGIGLGNTRARLNTLFEGSYTFTTTNAESRGLVVRLCIPYVVSVDPEASMDNGDSPD